MTSEHDGQGEQGRRGEHGRRGPRGEPGADPAEVLADALTALNTELSGVRNAVETERRGRRFTLTLTLVAVALAAVVSVAVFVDVRSNQVEADRRQWDQQVQIHDACERRNQNRRSTRDAFQSLYDLVAFAAGSFDLSDRDAALVDGFIAQGTMTLDDTLADVDCDAEAPLPEGERP